MATPIPATNRFNIEANRNPISLDLTNPQAPTSATYHGFSIQVGGVSIGRLTSWTPVQRQRTVTPIYELNAKTWGQAVDLVPGIEGPMEASFARAEVWGEEIERALGADDVYTLLVNQNAPFSIDEVYLRGGALYRMFRHLGCWFTSINTEDFSGEGDGIIRVNGTMMVGNKVKII